MEFFYEMDPLLRTFWYIALPASIIFVIQSVLTFAGLGETDDIDTEEGFQLFSFRNLINFLLGVGWTGASLYSAVTNKTLLILISVGVGAAFVYIFFTIIRQIQKLAENNSFRIESTINQNAEVYLTIPANKSGKGKVLISIKGSVRELEAITEGDPILSGTIVRVSGIANENVLIVVQL